MSPQARPARAAVPCLRSFGVRSLLAVLPVLLAISAPLAGSSAAPLPVGPDGRAEYIVARLVAVDDETFRQLLLSGLIVERRADGEAVGYLSEEGVAKVQALGIAIERLPDPGLVARDRAISGTEALVYHDYSALTGRLQQIADDHPAITRLVSAGQSVNGRELWWLKITDQPDVEEDEPGFKYIATMHGDEPPGTEMCLELIDVLTDGYGSDPRATRLVDEMEIWIMPMMNPDGNALSQRMNANGYDLNRNFPDRIDDPVDTTDGRQPETVAMMLWQDGHHTILSGNFHGGALVVNYPYDNNETHSNVYTAAPDDDILIDLSLEYSEDNAPMYNGSFDQGITNGADWYTTSGCMQDWNYTWRGDIDVTLEISNSKWPPASSLEGLWDDNRESMISYMERALTGVRGIVTDSGTGEPVTAELQIVGRGIPFFTDPEVGDFHRQMPAGSFTLSVEAAGYHTREVPFTVTDPEADAVRVDVALDPRDTHLVHQGHRVDADGGGDGWLDPGESGRLAVTLGNEGAVASGITGQLRPLGPYATVSTGAAWPDLLPGAAAESLPPHFELEVAPDAPAGHQLAFAVAWDAGGEASGLTEAFFVPIGAPAVDRHDALDVPLAIDDNATIESHVDLSDDRQLSEVNVGVDITHTYIGDLVVTLVAPDGSEYRLHERSGGSTDDLQTWYDTETAPVDSLDPLAGRSSAGRWTLRVEDRAGGDQGSLDGWTLETFSRPFEDPVAEVRLRDVQRAPGGGVTLTWWPVGSADSYRVYRSHDPGREEAFDDVTASDADPADTRFTDTQAAGSFACWIVSGEGHTGEGLWGHFGR